MRRTKIFKIYAIFWLFLFFLVFANLNAIVVFFLSAITFNVAVLTILSIGLVVIFKAAYDLVMISGTFGVIRYKKGKALEFYLSGIDKVFPENIAKTFKKRSTSESLFFTSREIYDVEEWLESKFFHHKVYINFFMGTALLIGLLGTFTGLLSAIGEMGIVVSSLQGDINMGEVMKRFEGPISGMAMGFGSSLFGVAAALVLSIKGYILNRNQENLSEDISDWMNSLTIDSGSVSAGNVETSASPISAIMDTFNDKISEFSRNMEKSNKTNESMVQMLTESMDNESKSARDQIMGLDNISSALKDLNLNQYQGTTSLNESLQDLSASMMNTNKNSKAMLELQQKNNELLLKLVDKLNIEEK